MEDSGKQIGQLSQSVLPLPNANKAFFKGRTEAKKRKSANLLKTHPKVPYILTFPMITAAQLLPTGMAAMGFCG